MRYGVCTWIFGDQPLERTAAQLASLGYDGMELAGDLARYRPAEARRAAADHGLEIISLTPDNVDLAHPERGTWREALDYYLRLVDFAAELGRPLVCCHGAVGRVRAISSYEGERALFLNGVREIAARAGKAGIRVALEVLNRYEAHLLNTGREALEFAQETGAPNVGVLLDAYHMNIEEADPCAAVAEAGTRLFLFHAADSNRQAVGRGHTDFPGLLRALRAISYDGAVIVECSAPGPDPFTPVKGVGWREDLDRHVSASLKALRRLEAEAAPA
jgi:D-psicose/D-tagatose/L-ribulose 3-epimerase